MFDTTHQEPCVKPSENKFDMLLESKCFDRMLCGKGHTSLTIKFHTHTQPQLIALCLKSNHGIFLKSSLIFLKRAIINISRGVSIDMPL